MTDWKRHPARKAPKPMPDCKDGDDSYDYTLEMMYKHHLGLAYE